MSSLRLAAALAVALTACSERPVPSENGPPAAISATVSALPMAPPPASAPPSIEAAGLAGAWEGHYDAKKSTVSLPPKVKDKGFAGDDGKTAVGPGTIALVIGADGALRGKGQGALGAFTLSGRVEEGAVRASLVADDPRADNAMSGVFLGALDGEALRGEIHVSGPDATVVRAGAFELKRK